MNTQQAIEYINLDPPPGAAGFCQHCMKRTIVHVIGVGSFCARHYVEYVEQNNAPITAELLAHYWKLAAA
jgi:hypothetical protein